MEKHELSKIDFEIIENALNALLESRPDPVTADKIAESSRPHKRCEGQKSESASRKARG
jgi:hypothetical protein